MNDWRKEIGVAHLVKQRVAQFDRDALWPFHLPEVAASEKQLEDADRSYAGKLDAQYRDFLRFANGWQGFFQSVDVFGTQDLLGGSRLQRAHELLDSLEPLEAACGVKRQECQPIAVSRDGIDVFCIANEISADAGAVVWFAGQVVQRFRDFDDFFLAMVDYNRLEAQAFGDADQ